MKQLEKEQLSDVEQRLMFDWYNHITTSSLIIIGGIIGFLPKGQMPVYALAALGFVITGAAVSLGASASLRPGGQKQSFWQFGRYFDKYAHTLVGIGAGIFVGGFVEKLI